MPLVADAMSYCEIRREGQSVFIGTARRGTRSIGVWAFSIAGAARIAEHILCSAFPNRVVEINTFVRGLLPHDSTPL